MSRSNILIFGLTMRHNYSALQYIWINNALQWINNAPQLQCPTTMLCCNDQHCTTIYLGFKSYSVLHYSAVQHIGLTICNTAIYLEHIWWPPLPKPSTKLPREELRRKWRKVKWSKKVGVGAVSEEGEEGWLSSWRREGTVQLEWWGQFR